MENINFKCSICDRTFVKREGLSYHVNHTKHNQCLVCGNYINNTSKFCSSSCSATFNNKGRIPSEEQRKKVSESLKGRKRKPNKHCLSCGKEVSPRNKSGYCRLCNNKHRVYTPELKRKLHFAGLKSVKSQADLRRSKNEMYFADLVKEHYNIVCNEPMFNGWDADIIIPDLKVAILWNGNWHYKQIKGSLKQVQNRDKIKLSEIKKCGYIPYIIKDEGKFSIEKCEKEFEILQNFLRNLK